MANEAKHECPGSSLNQSTATQSPDFILGRFSLRSKIFQTALLIAIAMIAIAGCGAPEAEVSASRTAPSKPAEAEIAKAATVEETAAVEEEYASEPEFYSASPVEDRSEHMTAPVAAPPQRPAAAPATTRNNRYSNKRAVSSAQKSWSQKKRSTNDFVVDAREPSEEPAPALAAPIVAKEEISEPDPQPAVSESLDAKLPTQVEVFYATDRKSIAAVSKGDLWKVFGWAAQLGLVALVTGFAGSFYQRQGIKLIAAAAGIACLVLAYGGWIEWQQRVKLKDNGDIWYTHDLKVPSYEPTRHIAVTGDSESLDYGICVVSIPPNHQTGIVESPSITRFELTEDKEKHVVLEKIDRSDSSEFFNQLNKRLESGSNEALIFIHGYNVSFNNAVKRTAQISHDVKFQGTPICYSWPSRGGLEDYTRDMANADWSVIHLQQFLAEMFENSNADKVHLIAHSMGNRVLMQALDRLALQNQSDTQFGQIVLAAPDVSANDFRQRYSNVIRQMSDHVTLYASSRDRALMVSAGVHGHDRAGLAGDEIVIVDGIDTIDVSHVDTSLIGHSYYGDNPELIDDLAAIILQAKPTSSRSWLRRIDTAANRFYWKFR